MPPSLPPPWRGTQTRRDERPLLSFRTVWCAGAARREFRRVLTRTRKGDMITKVQLFLNIKNEGAARPLGVRRLRRAPGCGQKFEIAIDGRSVRARIMRFRTRAPGHLRATVPDVYADEI